MTIISDDIISWKRAKEIIRSNALDQLYRNHAETVKYRAYKERVAAKGSTIVQEIVKVRLGWSKGITPSSHRLFHNANDVLIITNDFPYNFEKSITHFVVWSKVIIESDPESDIGDVSDETRNIIDAYMQKTFVKQLGLKEESLVWFRNFPAIQSVKELSHIHVLVKNMEQEAFDKVIGTPGVLLE